MGPYTLIWSFFGGHFEKIEFTDLDLARSQKITSFLDSVMHLAYRITGLLKSMEIRPPLIIAVRPGGRITENSVDASRPF